MKVLIIARGFATTKRPMNGNFETIQAKALRDFGHDVAYASVSLYSIRTLNEVGFHYNIIEGIHVYALNGFIPFRFLPNKFKSWYKKKLLKLLYKIIEKKHGKPDIMHSHYLRVSELALEIKKHFEVPWICTEHWSEINKDKIAIEVKKIGDKVYNNVDKIISVSNYLSKRIKMHFNVDTTTIYNMVPNNFFNVSSDRVKVDKNIFSFITVGSLIPIKDHLTLISAFAKAFKNQNVILKIVGGGPLRNYLQQIINSLYIQSQVVLIGPQDYSKVDKLLNDSDAFVLSSKAETFGVVLIEAMAKGLPVVATKCGGPEELVNSSNGLLVDVGDVDGFSKALLQLRRDIIKYERKVISESTKKQFSSQIIAKKITDEYSKILDKNKTNNEARRFS